MVAGRVTEVTSNWLLKASSPISVTVNSWPP